MSSPSSEAMWTSADDCFCQEQLRQSRSPNSSAAQTRRSSAGSASIWASVRESCVLTQQELLQRVGSQPEAKRLERDDLVGRDVAEVDVGPVLLNKPRLRLGRRRLEDDVGEVELVDDLVDQAGAHVAGGAEDPGRPALTGLRDHLPGAGFQVF